MADCPQHRLRLFLSVDLAGSTAFKAGYGGGRNNDDPFPRWVSVIRDFYGRFPAILQQHYEAMHVGASARVLGSPPVLWKTVGDEILFCSRLHSREHLACSVEAFLKALDSYGESLDRSGKHLDVKGAGWIASFPSPNVTVELASDKKFGGHNSNAKLDQMMPVSYDYVNEQFEQQADSNPGRFDFLGKEIDTGFRVAKHAATDKFISSVELAWLLADAAHNRLFNGRFAYHGRQVLKGVLRDRPYPIISIDAERNALRREVRQRERALIGDTYVESINLRDFLESFMRDVDIDQPVLPSFGQKEDRSVPKAYAEFQALWPSIQTENQKRAATEEEAEEVNAQGDELSAEVFESTNLLIAQANRQQPSEMGRDIKTDSAKT